MSGSPMRFHVVSLPHTQVTRDFATDAFTEKVRRFTSMMTRAGHTTYLYAGELSEAESTEHIVCFNEAERREAVGDKHYVAASFDPNAPHWQRFNSRVIAAIRERLEPHDFICITGGTAQRPIADAFPGNAVVEHAVGYSGSFAKFRIFESYAWMHSSYAAWTNPADVDGNFYDTVIPGYLEPEMFPFVAEPDDYYLFLGRVTQRKGVQIAADTCKALGKRLIIAGPGEPPGYGEYVGEVGPAERARLLGGAIASFAPTIYVEPFGNVVIESQACGTPTITTDWGAFTETNINGLTGYRCRTLQQFIDAAEAAPSLDRRAIHEHAVANYSLAAIQPRFEAYFRHLATLWDGGWYQRRS